MSERDKYTEQAERCLAKWRAEGREINDDLVFAVAAELLKQGQRIEALEEALAQAKQDAEDNYEQGRKRAALKE